MREIKFRVWDKITKKYFYSGTLDNGDVLVIHLDGEIEISSDDTYKPEDFVIEQFTGLRDKTGRCGYHEDIIIHPSAGTSVIKWFNNGWRTRSMVSGLYYDIADGKFEIIGNTNENPELLP
ncbi:MAG: YopX family protein [Dehalococcoidia bacterium]